MGGPTGTWDANGRVCTKCQKRKPWGEFQKQSNGVNGRRARCRACKTQDKYDWVARNQEKHDEYQRQFRVDGRFALAMRQHYERNRELKIHNTVALYGARAPGTFSFRDWTRLLARFDGMCAYCRERPARDREHVIPVCRGGNNTIGNILPACRPCNLSKGKLTLMEWRLSGRAPAVMTIPRGEAA